ncbi:hypothetical protein MnTg02_02089 [bacterium MnTg02]|nr:hypothetical protein MnTg02_02089 [bacterium MnTg02]
MMEWFEYLYDPQFVVITLTAIAAFATIVTFTMPLLETDKLDSRMKYVSSERDKLRAERLAELNAEAHKGSLRQKPKGFMQQVVQQLNLRKVLETNETRNKLRMAGFRGQAPVVAFLFFRVTLPILGLVGALIYLFFVNDHGYSPLMRLSFSVGGAYAGFFLPNVFISNLIQKRQKSIKQAFPDALDLLLICVQSGMSIEAAFSKVSKELGSQSIELAEELTLMTAELSYLQDRRQAYENLGTRTGLPDVKAVCTSLIQAERYGTPLSQALRVLAQESRDTRMAEAEKKAASLPPKLTVPMILFFLPVLFVVILGPAVMKVMAL